MKSQSLEIASCKVALDVSRPSDLIDAATDALVEGLDTPSLRILAGLAEADGAEVKKMFDRSLDELNISLPNEREAALRLAQLICIEILTGQTHPYKGAKRIWKLSLQVNDEEMPELDPFIYSFSEWEERPEDRKFFEDKIMIEAREFLHRCGVDTGER
ncbi:MAG: hypothetical protein ACYC4M_04345 [Thermoleophilia bacterium]